MYRLKILVFNIVLFCLAACAPGDPVTPDGMTGSDSSPAVPMSPPNILYIVADGLGFTDIGAFRSEIPTPNLDRLAYAGFRLNNFHAAEACRNSRLMMMSGVGRAAANFTIPDIVDNRLENFGRPNSLIDHGRGFGEAASAPFKYYKGRYTEGGLRAAAFVHYPAVVAGGEVSNAFMTMMDISPNNSGELKKAVR